MFALNGSVLSLEPMTPENESAVYAFLNRKEISRWISSGYDGPKHSGTSLKPLNDFMSCCLLAFVIVDHSLNRKFGVIEEEWRKLKDAKGGDGKAEADSSGRRESVKMF